MKRRIQRPLFAFVSCFILVVVFQNCGQFKTAGVVSSPSGGGDLGAVDPGGSNPGGTANESAKFSCTEPALRGTSDRTIRRLTRFEYENSLKDIFGTDVVEKVASPLSSYPNESFRKSVSEFTPSFTQAAVDVLTDVASAVAEQVSGSTTYLKRVAPTCLFNSSNAIDLTNATCVKSFVDDLGLKIYRRPLTAAESDGYVQVLKMSSTVVTTNAERVAVMIGQMLLKPDFAFLMLNAPVVSGDRYKLDPYSVASRLSYRVIGSTPDAELLAAAKAGSLSTPEQLKTQALRLLKKTSANAYTEAPGRRFVRNFIKQWIQASQSRAADVFYSGYFGVNQLTINDAMSEEALRFGEYIAFEKNGNFVDLMTSDVAFPPNDDLAKIMGTGVSSGVMDPKTVPDERRGLFQRPVLMVSAEPRTPPLHRGAMFLQNALCVNLGNPPPNADAVASDTKNSIDMDSLTSRQVSTAVTATTSCQACHSMINPPGFVFETFGPLGETRKNEKIFDANRALVNTLPVDANSQVTLDGAAKAINGPLDLAAALANSSQIKACMSQQMFRLTRFKVEDFSDSCHLSEVENLIRSGAPILEAFALNAATEDLLWVKIN